MVPTISHAYSEIYPRQYIAYRAPARNDRGGPAITIDGNLDKPFWNEVPWTEDFVDIATDMTPKFRTRAKLRWDEEFLYVGECCFDSDAGTHVYHLTMQPSIICSCHDGEKVTHICIFLRFWCSILLIYFYIDWSDFICRKKQMFGQR